MGGQEIALEGLSLKSSSINEIQLTAYPAADLQPLEYVLSIQAVDQNSNTQSAEWTFIVIGPPIEFPIDGNLNRFQDEAEKKWVSVSATTIEGQLDIAAFPGGGKVEIYRNNQLQAEVKIDLESGHFTADLPLLEGENSISILPVNAVGLKGQLTPAGIFVVDTQKPLIKSLQPGSGSILPEFNQLRAVITDSTIVSSMVSGLDRDSIRLTIDGQPVENYTYDQSSGLLTYQLAPQVATEIGPVEHTIILEASDQLGNTGRVEAKFQVDADEDDENPPVIAGVYPRSGQVINAEDVSSLEIRATVYDVASGLADVQIRLDGLVIDQPEAEK